MSVLPDWPAPRMQRCCREYLAKEKRDAAIGDGAECPYCYIIMRLTVEGWEPVQQSEPFFEAFSREMRQARDERTAKYFKLLGRTDA